MLDEGIQNKLREMLNGTDLEFFHNYSIWIDEEGDPIEEDREGATRIIRRQYNDTGAITAVKKIIDTLSTEDNAGIKLMNVLDIIINIDLDPEYTNNNKPNAEDMINYTLQKLIILPEEQVNDRVLTLLRNAGHYFSPHRLFAPFEYGEDTDYSDRLNILVQRELRMAQLDETIQSKQIQALLPEPPKNQYSFTL